MDTAADITVNSIISYKAAKLLKQMIFYRVLGVGSVEPAFFIDGKFSGRSTPNPRKRP